MPLLGGSGDLFGSPHSANYNGPVVDDLYTINREWAEEQAQKQMDYQTAANKIAMDFSAEQVEKQRAFELEMANSAFQRRVLDLKKRDSILSWLIRKAALPFPRFPPRKVFRLPVLRLLWLIPVIRLPLML